MCAFCPEVYWPGLQSVFGIQAEDVTGCGSLTRYSYSVLSLQTQWEARLRLMKKGYYYLTQPVNRIRPFFFIYSIISIFFCSEVILCWQSFPCPFHFPIHQLTTCLNKYAKRKNYCFACELNNGMDFLGWYLSFWFPEIFPCFLHHLSIKTWTWEIWTLNHESQIYFLKCSSLTQWNRTFPFFKFDLQQPNCLFKWLTSSPTLLILHLLKLTLIYKDYN